MTHSTDAFCLATLNSLCFVLFWFKIILAVLFLCFTYFKYPLDPLATDVASNFDIDLLAV